jgi:hypothetical protein
MTKITIYFDSQDPQDIGWAWRTAYDSGRIDGLAADCCDALRDGIQTPAGSWDALMEEVPVGEVWLIAAEGTEPVRVSPGKEIDRCE